MCNVLNLAQVDERKQMASYQGKSVKQQGSDTGELMALAYQKNLPANIVLKLGMYHAKLVGFTNVDDVMEFVDGFSSQFPISLQITAEKGE